MARAPETSSAYLRRRKQDDLIFAIVLVALALFWFLFPALLDSRGRYSDSIKTIVIKGWPVWLGLTYITYRGWLDGRKRKSK